MYQDLQIRTNDVHGAIHKFHQIFSALTQMLRDIIHRQQIKISAVEALSRFVVYNSVAHETRVAMGVLKITLRCTLDCQESGAYARFKLAIDFPSTLSVAIEKLITAIRVLKS